MATCKYIPKTVDELTAPFRSEAQALLAKASALRDHLAPGYTVQDANECRRDHQHSDGQYWITGGSGGLFGGPLIGSGRGSMSDASARLQADWFLNDQPLTPGEQRLADCTERSYACYEERDATSIKVMDLAKANTTLQTKVEDLRTQLSVETQLRIDSQANNDSLQLFGSLGLVTALMIGYVAARKNPKY